MSEDKYKAAIEAYAKHAKAYVLPERLAEHSEKGTLLMKDIVESGHVAGVDAAQIAFDLTTALMKGGPFEKLWQKSMEDVAKKMQEKDEEEEKDEHSQSD